MGKLLKACMVLALVTLAECQCTYPNGVLNCSNFNSSQVSIVLPWKSIKSPPSDVFSGLTNLEYINLEWNSITELPSGVFANLNNLYTLFLAGNQIKFLPKGLFDGLTKLENLHLDYNNFTELKSGMFDGLTDLQYLWLNSNQITKIHSGVFQHLNRLATLWLSHNQITKLPSGVFQHQKLSRSNGLVNWPTSINIGYNPLDVTYQLCSLVSFKMYLRNRKWIRYIDDNKLTECSSSCDTVSLSVLCPESTGSTGIYCSGTIGNHSCSKDIDECAAGANGPCPSVNGFCTNTVGSYVCECAPGYTAVGTTCSYWYGGAARRGCTNNDYFVALPNFSMAKDRVSFQTAREACQSFGMDIPSRREQLENCFFDAIITLFPRNLVTPLRAYFFYTDSQSNQLMKSRYGFDYAANRNKANYLCYANFSREWPVSTICKGTYYTVPNSASPGQLAVNWDVASLLCQGKLVSISDMSPCLVAYIKSVNVMFGISSGKVWTKETQMSLGNNNDYSTYFTEASATELLPLCKDTDECASRNRCPNVNSKCVNTLGSYRCECSRGFQGDGSTCSYWFGGVGRPGCEKSDYFVALPQFSMARENVPFQTALDACQSFGLQLPTFHHQLQHCFYRSMITLLPPTAASHFFWFLDSRNNPQMKHNSGRDYPSESGLAKYVCYADLSQRGIVQRTCNTHLYYVPKIRNSRNATAFAANWTTAYQLCPLVSEHDNSRCFLDFVKSLTGMFYTTTNARIWSRTQYSSLGTLGNYRTVVMEPKTTVLLPVCKEVASTN